MTAVGDVLELDVGAPAHGGSCITRHEGRAVFVRHALPGERVRANVTEVRPRYLRADAVAVLSASPHRVQPPCPYAGPGRCGGCDWQHVAVDHQRTLLAAVVGDQLRRLAGVDIPVDVRSLPGVPGCAPGLGWRTRVQFHVRRDGVVGFHRHRSHTVEPVERCLIAHPLVEDAGVERRRWPRLRGVEVIAAPGSGSRAVVVTPVGRRQPVKPVALDAPASFLRDDGHGHTTALAGASSLGEEAAGRQWRVTGNGFWQVHPAAADTLAAAVRRAVAARPGERVLDLYSGAGLFAGVLAELVGSSGRVLAVEGATAAAADAVVNLADLPQVTVERARITAEAMGSWTGRLGGPPDVVVLDPPRTGAGIDVVHALAEAAPRVICYVACDPAALARDAAALAGAGYPLAGLEAFALFPMTAHVECVATFRPAHEVAAGR